MDPMVPPGSDAKAIHSIAADNGAGPAVIWHRAGKGGWLSPFILRTVAAYAVRSLAECRGAGHFSHNALGFMRLL